MAGLLKGLVLNPNANPATITLNFERALYWVNVGTQPTDTVRSILSKEGVLLMKHLQGGVKKGAFDEADTTCLTTTPEELFIRSAYVGCSCFLFLDVEMSSPLVSVIVPNFNYARYLPDRMESIFGQTFHDFEVIILDDCSTDDSRTVIENYRDNPKVSAIIYNDENSGSPFKQWFKGIKEAKGELIWITESDDSAKPDFLEKMVKGLRDNPSAVLAISGTDVIDENGNRTTQTFDRWDKGDEQGSGVTKLYDGKRYLVHNLYWACYVYNASCVVFRKEGFFKDDYSRSLTMRNAGDWLFWSRMLCHGDILELREKLSYLRRHSQSVTFIGNKNGNLLKEDAVVIKAIESMVNVGRYRKMIRHGEMLKRVSRMDIPEETKRQYRQEVKDELNATEFEYIVERINKPFTKYLPFLITSAQDLI